LNDRAARIAEACSVAGDAIAAGANAVTTLEIRDHEILRVDAESACVRERWWATRLDRGPRETLLDEPRVWVARARTE
jgi:hypothetical protein